MVSTVDELLSYACVPISVFGGTPERTTAENFVGVYQATDKWCWAAVAASVVTFYGAKGASVHPQCAIVDRDDPCGTHACNCFPDRPMCGQLKDGADIDAITTASCVNEAQNREGFLYRALDKQGMLAGWVSLRSGRARRIKDDENSSEEAATLDSSLDIDALKRLLEARHLICLRTRRNGMRHFIIVYGCETYPDYSLLIWDPANGSDVIEVDRFVQEYGPFTHKIVTRAPPTTNAAEHAA